MPKFEIKIDWSGYCRGIEVRHVEADTEDEARKYWYEGKVVLHEIVRDDTEREVRSVTRLNEVAPPSDAFRVWGNNEHA